MRYKLNEQNMISGNEPFIFKKYSFLWITYKVILNAYNIHSESSFLLKIVPRNYWNTQPFQHILSRFNKCTFNIVGFNLKTTKAIKLLISRLTIWLQSSLDLKKFLFYGHRRSIFYGSYEFLMFSNIVACLGIIFIKILSNCSL